MLLVQNVIAVMPPNSSFTVGSLDFLGDQGVNKIETCKVGLRVVLWGSFRKLKKSAARQWIHSDVLLIYVLPWLMVVNDD